MTHFYHSAPTALIYVKVRWNLQHRATASHLGHIGIEEPPKSCIYVLPMLVVYIDIFFYNLYGKHINIIWFIVQYAGDHILFLLLNLVSVLGFLLTFRPFFSLPSAMKWWPCKYPATVKYSWSWTHSNAFFKNNWNNNFFSDSAYDLKWVFSLPNIFVLK